MKKVIVALSVALVFLVACSTSERANRHLKKAIKLDPSIVHTYHDTIVKTISDSGEVHFYGDTIVENNFVFISIKHEGDKTNLYWYLKSVKIEFPVDNTFITPPKTRQEIRLKYKTIERLIKSSTKVKKEELKQEGRTKRREIKSENKTERKNNRSSNLFLIGFLIGFLINHIGRIITIIKKIVV